MTALAQPDWPQATDGEIAAINLESARRAAWTRFELAPERADLAEAVVDHERLALQFLGDVDALGRLERLAGRLGRGDGSYRTALVEAEIASAAHRFGDARMHLARAARLGGPHAAIERQTLASDQACGSDLEAVLAARQRIAAASCRLEDLVPLGALLADLERSIEADAVYRQALYAYDDVSPLPLAWVCFQLGMLWGELVPAPAPTRAALWYGQALAYLPGYVKARVHLAEIHASQDHTVEAEALLLPALPSGDPEVHWRLADVLLAQERSAEAKSQLEIARAGFERLLDGHLLAYADHGAEFYAGTGNDTRRALELARANAANRPTHRAIQQVHTIEMIAESRRGR